MGPRDAAGRTPLYAAAYHGREELALRLLEVGADPNAGQSARPAPPANLQLAAEGSAAAPAPLEGGGSPLCAAAERGYPQVRWHKEKSSFERAPFALQGCHLPCCMAVGGTRGAQLGGYLMATLGRKKNTWLVAAARQVLCSLSPGRECSAIQLCPPMPPCPSPAGGPNPAGLWRAGE